MSAENACRSRRSDSSSNGQAWWRVGVFTSLTCALLLPGPAIAQHPVEEAVTPEATATAFFAALHDARWSDAATFVDSSSARRLQRWTVGALVAWAQHLDELRRIDRKGRGGDVTFGYSYDSTANPPALSRYGATPLKGFGTVHSIGDIADRSPAAFLATLMQVTDSVGRGRHAGPATVMGRRVLGAVVEGDSVAHVLYRLEGGQVLYTDPLHVEMLHLRRSGPGSWLVELSPEPEDVANPGLLLIGQIGFPERRGRDDR